jgi:peptidyl-tRNA hydrolase, PTH1 family
VFLIVGLGNIGSEYENSRHNIGFMVVDEMIRKLSAQWFPGKGDYFYSNVIYYDRKIMFLKPSTFMNNSGIAVLDALQFFKVDPLNLLIICDDFNLPLGKLRMRPKGSDGGHNGLSSIIYSLMMDDFPRLRIGIGNKFEKGAMSNFVLSDFNKDEIPVIKDSIRRAVESVFCFVSEGINIAMTKFN